MKIFKMVIWVLSIFFLFLSPAIGKTIHVPADSSTIQKGINGASYGDTVLVGVGIFSQATNGEKFPIYMKNGAVLVTEKGIEYTWIQANYDSTVIKCLNLDSNTVIKGFKINKGKSTKGGGIYCENSSLKILENEISLNQGGSGAGIYCQSNSSPQIIGNIISNNNMVSTGDGGGICCLGGSPRIIGNTITYNKSINYGGGIYCQSSFPEIRQNEISWNQGYAGGGIFSWADSSLIIENTISHNRLHVFQAILYGAGLYCGDGSYRITKNKIIANDAIVGGYGPRAYGGAIFCQNSFVEITDNLIDSNSIWGVYNACIYSEGYGAGICSFQCPSLMISNNVITNNYTMMPVSSGFGAGIYSKGLSPQIIDNVIQNNGYTGYEQSIYGSGIYFASSVLPRVQRNLIVKNAAHYGGGLYIKDSFVDSLNNNTLDSNSGGGITSNNSHLKIFNNIISNSPSGQGIVSTTNSLLEIFYNDVWNNIGGNFLNCPAGIGDTTWGLNRNNTPCDSFYNITRDPLFSYAPENWYYLKPESPCINAGNPFSPRDPDSTIADQGAYYYPVWQRYYVSGNVRDKFDQPVIGQTVYLKDLDFDVLHSTKTNSIGDFKFLGLIPTNYLDLFIDSTCYVYKYRPLNSSKEGQNFKWNGSCYTDVGDDQEAKFIDFSISQNYPNPFNSVTIISYTLPKAMPVNLTVYNILGERVATLVDEWQLAGHHTVTWNAERKATGIYFYCLKAGTMIETKKMVLIK